jgi:hypothetical protein
MRFTAVATLAGLLLGLGQPAQSDSNVAFPDGWRDWPAVKEGRLPGSEATIPDDLPSIVKETIKMYSWVNGGNGSAYKIRIKPDDLAAYNAGGRAYSDGPTAVFQLTDANVMFVTGHVLGSPVYGVYAFDKTDLAGTQPSLKTKQCQRCHSGYQEFCTTGVCNMKVK